MEFFQDDKNFSKELECNIQEETVFVLEKSALSKRDLFQCPNIQCAITTLQFTLLSTQFPTAFPVLSKRSLTSIQSNVIGILISLVQAGSGANMESLHSYSTFLYENLL